VFSFILPVALQAQAKVKSLVMRLLTHQPTSPLSMDAID
jgi:hypothetical protein